MRKALTITLVAALALFAGSAAYANYCARDVVPASTILVPYAVQDMLDTYNPDYAGYTTILTVTNVSREAQIIHITVWNALSEPCIDFNEVLTGYDVWQIFFRDMLDGNFGFFDTSRSATAYPNVESLGTPHSRLPFEWGPDGRSAYSGNYNPAAQTTDTGALPYPQTSGVVPSTNCFMPYGNGLNVNSNIDCLRAPIYARDHNGCGNLGVRADFNNDWLKNIDGTHSDGYKLWFYVTVDLVDECNFAFPNDTNYFENYYVNENVLIGDIVYLDSTANFSEAINAVHIETDPPNGWQANMNAANFYEEKALPLNTPFNHLEPLATAFAFNYYNNPGLNISSEVMLWKNYEDFLAVGATPNHIVDDCGYYIYYAWDFDEHSKTRAGSCRISPCNPNDIDPNEFPFETQSVPLTLDNFDLVDVQGWMLIVFPPSYPAGFADPTTNTESKTYLMGWVGTKINYGGYSAALEAATMANYWCFGQQGPGYGINFDYDPPSE
jgi:hypothetical protein